MRFDFVPVDDAAQAASPRHRRNTRIVNASLIYRFPGEPPASRLSGSEPHAVDFGNHISAEQNADFVDAELLRCAARGVVREWDPARHGGSTPTAVSSLRIVAKAGGTLRMCVSPMYTNLFIRYRAFAYDRVVDLSAMADEGCFMFSTTMKAATGSCSCTPWRSASPRCAGTAGHSPSRSWPSALPTPAMTTQPLSAQPTRGQELALYAPPAPPLQPTTLAFHQETQLRARLSD